MNERREPARSVAPIDTTRGRGRWVRCGLSLALILGAACARQPGADSILIVANGTVVTMDAARRVLSPGSVAIQDGRIVAVDAPPVVSERYPGARMIDASGRVILPGLVNTHTHAPMVMYRGLADDLALMDWLQRYIFPAEAKTVSPEFVRIGTRLAALEMIRSGTTTFADMYYFEEEIARATAEAGLRGVLGQTIIEFPSPDAKTPADGLARADAFIQAFRNHPLVTPAIAPHSTYTLDRETLLASRDLAIRHSVPMLIHLAETDDERAITTKRFGQRPVGVLEALGLWGPRIVAAHGVWIAPDEIQLLKAHDVGVSHNPESNMKLASGTAPVVDYLAAGVSLGLGTDGAASNNDLDMFEAMRQAAFLHKLATRDPRAVSAQTALELGTIGGARVLGLSDRIGSLEVGKRADLIVVRMNQARQTPMFDPISHLVYVTRGDDVQTTIVDGRVLMHNGRVLSLPENEVLAAARTAAVDVRKAVAGDGQARP